MIPIPTRDISGRYKGLVRWYLWDTAPWGRGALNNYFETKYKNINITIIVIIGVFSVHNVI